MILEAFVRKHRAEIVARARLRIGERIAPIPTEAELDHGVELFLDDLLDALSPQKAEVRALAKRPILHSGFTIAQVVYDFGDICQAITELVGERDETLDAREFRILNQCLDDAIASAVTEFARKRDVKTVDRQSERLKVFAERLRTDLSTALLAYEMVQRGTVGASGSTGALIARSLSGLRRSIDQTLALARLESGSAVTEPVEIARVMEEIEVSAVIEARGRGVRFAASLASRDIHVMADRELLLAALTSLVESAIQAAPRAGLVKVTIQRQGSSVSIDVIGSGAYAASDVQNPSIARDSIVACGGTLESTVAHDGRKQRVVLQSAPLVS